VTNAMEAIGRAGVIALSVSATDGAAIVSIADNGPGIPAEVRPHIFDPFFSGREAGRGLGFGLSKSWRIVDEHGGTIEVADAMEGGASFVVRLPLVGPVP
jgi:C4-dicarboxylate-specific signal transduction histidine kinase